MGVLLRLMRVFKLQEAEKRKNWNCEEDIMDEGLQDWVSLE